MPLRLEWKRTRLFSRSCVDLTNTRAAVHPEGGQVGVGFGGGSQLALGQDRVVDGKLRRARSHSNDRIIEEEEEDGEAGLRRRVKPDVIHWKAKVV